MPVSREDLILVFEMAQTGLAAQQAFLDQKRTEIARDWQQIDAALAAQQAPAQGEDGAEPDAPPNGDTTDGATDGEAPHADADAGTQGDAGQTT